MHTIIPLTTYIDLADAYNYYTNQWNFQESLDKIDSSDNSTDNSFKNSKTLLFISIHQLQNSMGNDGNIKSIEKKLLEHNIIFCERVNQLIEFTHLFKNDNKFIIITESYIPRDEDNFFSTMKNITIFTSLPEVHTYGSWLYSPISQLFWHDYIPYHDSPKYDFFCLLSRTDHIRDYFIKTINDHLDLSSALIRYDNNNYGNDDINTIDYITPQFGTNYSTDTIIDSVPFLNTSRFVIHDFYLKSRFEVQIETSPWTLTEYHPTEKTLNPLTFGYPCLMLGAYKYNHWLKEFGIDLGMGMFDMSYDLIKNDKMRINAFIKEISRHKSFNISNTTRSNYHKKNLEGLHNLSKFSRQSEQLLFKYIKQI